MKNNNKYNLTEKRVFVTLVTFAFPFLISSFLQTLYGMVDLYVIGLFNGPAQTTAVSVGSQVMHMLTVIIIGLAMGATVNIGKYIGAKNSDAASKVVGNASILFFTSSVILMIVLLICINGITSIMSTPIEAVRDTKTYLTICFAGIPVIVAYNVMSSIYRGVGDSRTPMFFVGIACVINIILDFILVGYMKMGASGAAIATVLAQLVSVVLVIAHMIRSGFVIDIKRGDFHLNKTYLGEIIKIGFPIALQDGFIQVSFIIITIIANSRGLIYASGVGVVEKIIGFFFLVPSAFLSALSVLTAQNIGAGKTERAHSSLRIALIISVIYGAFIFIYCQFLPETLVGIFTESTDVIEAGSLYLRSYSLDCMIASIHFCFSGYFCGRGNAKISFVHNIVSIILMRIPGAYFAAKIFPDTLYPMGLAAPLGSAISAIICIVYFITTEKNDKYDTFIKSDKKALKV